MENGSLKLKVLAIQNLSDVMIIVNIMYYVLLLLLLTFICHWKRKQLKCMCTA